MKNNKRYWKGLEELNNDAEFVKHADKEFPGYLPTNKQKQNGGKGGDSRRDFLKMMGFGISAATLAACETPVRKAIPYVVKPADVDPSIPNYYASSYVDGGDYCSVVVKTREGRPIKVKGNERSGITRGRTNAQVEASVLSLYDSDRLEGPVINGEPTTWGDLDKTVTSQLRSASSAVLVSYTIMSPSTQAAIDQMLSAYPGMRHVVYDPVSAEGMLEANRQSFGQAVIPAYDFSRADTIVSFGADFLGTWIAPIVYARQYADTRKLGQDKKNMSRHYQFEANLSLSGANADYRQPMRPSQEGLYVGHLYNLLAARAGATTANVNKLAETPVLAKAANDLWSSRSKSLVVSGSNDPAVQGMVNAINELLGNYGTTLNINRPAHFRQGSTRDLDQLTQQVSKGSVDAVIFYNCNPVYDYHNGMALGEGLAKVKTKVATAGKIDETAALANIIAPDHHYLESWNDVEAQTGFLSVGQPAITPIFDTRQAQGSFLTWAGNGETNYYQYLRQRWQDGPFAAQSGTALFEDYWNQMLYDGAVEIPGSNAESTTAGQTNVSSLASAINDNYPAQREGTELVIYQKVGIGNGRQANNPWLQEMPDPISKACWDNYLTVSQAKASELGVKMENMMTSLAKVTVSGTSVTVPILVQPGQAEGTVGLALGYGRTKAGKVADGLGVNAYPMVSMTNGFASYFNTDVQIEVLSDQYRIAQTQTHETYMGRETIIQDALLAEYQEDPAAGRFKPHIETYDGPKEPSEISMWKGHAYPNHHWMMAIDMNSCIGCGACTVACQVENNVPVVGRQEVINRREMHWIRIDRYYSSDAPVGDYEGMEVASQNPEVTFQPMLCQQCNNAPCETVCPVAATTHSSEGLNQMTYNRCIGTRYCANNCPYKVRRFNWFKYHDNEQFAGVNVAMNDELGKMVLNPDVTVRARGVMEKCTFCIQRIQLGKLEAKKEGRRPKNGEINSACAEACPTRAITFGDANDAQSDISKLMNSEYGERAYRVLEEIGVSPNIWYLSKIRNKDLEEEKVI